MVAKILLLQDEHADKVGELLSKMLETTGAKAETHRSLVITSSRPEVLSALKILFGGTYYYAEYPTAEPIGESPIKYQPPAPRMDLTTGIIAQNDSRDRVHEHMITVTDQLIEKTEELNFPSLRKQPREKGKKGRPEVRSWHVVLNDQDVEQITNSEKTRRLNAGEFETGVLLRHPKAGMQRVTGEKGTLQGIEPVA